MSKLEHYYNNEEWEDLYLMDEDEMQETFNVKNGKPKKVVQKFKSNEGRKDDKKMNKRNKTVLSEISI